jgi:DNA-binding transcriptional ArsR family regulator
MVYHGRVPIASPTSPVDEDVTLDLVFRALGDPTRRAIITQLTRGEATMTQIASQFDMTLPGVSKHVGVLEDAGLVHRWRSGRTRRCRLEVERMLAANAWVDAQTRFWTETLEGLAAFIENEPPLT